MNYEGNLHLVRMNRSSECDLDCNVMFAENRAGSGGVMKPRRVIGESTLRQFLTGRVHADSDLVDAALKELRQHGSAGLPNVLLSGDELRDLGLR
jgi:hypothetical protein